MAVFKLLESDNPILKVKLEDCNPELNRQEIKDNLIENGLNLKPLNKMKKFI